MSCRWSPWIGLVTAFVVAGCKKDKKPPADAAPAAAPTERVAIDKTLLGSAVGPFGTLAGLDVGMSLEDARGKRPALYEGDSPVPYEDPKYQVSYYVAHDGATGPVARLMIAIDGEPDVIRAAITGAWGEPFAVTSYADHPRYFWFNPKGGWRARLDQKTLWLERYVPLSALLDRAGSMIGTPVAELEAKLGAGYDKPPPTEFGGGDHTKMRVESDGDPPVVDTVRITIFYDVYNGTKASPAKEIRDHQWKLFLGRFDQLETRRKGDEDIHTFREKDPRVVITERSGISHRFEIAMSQ